MCNSAVQHMCSHIFLFKFPVCRWCLQCGVYGSGQTGMISTVPSIHFRPRVRPSVWPSLLRGEQQQVCCCSPQRRASRWLFWKQSVRAPAGLCDQVRERDKEWGGGVWTIPFNTDTRARAEADRLPAGLLTFLRFRAHIHSYSTVAQVHQHLITQSHC